MEQNQYFTAPPQHRACQSLFSGEESPGIAAGWSGNRPTKLSPCSQVRQDLTEWLFPPLQPGPKALNWLPMLLAVHVQKGTCRLEQKWAWTLKIMVGKSSRSGTKGPGAATLCLSSPASPKPSC